jgi:hypothetical protein
LKKCRRTVTIILSIKMIPFTYAIMDQYLLTISKIT